MATSMRIFCTLHGGRDSNISALRVTYTGQRGLIKPQPGIHAAKHLADAFDSSSERQCTVHAQHTV